MSSSAIGPLFVLLFVLSQGVRAMRDMRDVAEAVGGRVDGGAEPSGGPDPAGAVRGGPAAMPIESCMGLSGQSSSRRCRPETMKAQGVKHRGGAGHE